MRKRIRMKNYLAKIYNPITRKSASAESLWMFTVCAPETGRSGYDFAQNIGIDPRLRSRFKE